jgi:hypothetical protein
MLDALGLTVTLSENPAALARSRRSHAWQQRKIRPWWKGDGVRPSAAERNGSAEPADGEGSKAA